MFIFILFAFLIIPMITTAQLDFPIYTVRQNGLGGISALSTDGTAVFHNPAGINGTQLSGGIGNFYGDSGIINCYMSANWQHGIAGAGLGIQYFGGGGYSIWSGIGGAVFRFSSASFGIQYGLISETVNRYRVHEAFAGMGYRVAIGSRITIAGILQAYVFKGDLLTFGIIASSIRVTDGMQVKIQFNDGPVHPGYFILGCELNVIKKLTIVAGLETGGWSSGIGMEYVLKQVTIAFSITGHPYLGSRALTGFNYVFSESK